MAIQPNLLTSEPSTPPTPGDRGKRHVLRNTVLVLVAVAVLVTASAGAYLFNLAQIYESGVTTIEDAFPDESTRPKPRSQAAGPGSTAGEPGGVAVEPGNAAGEPGNVPGAGPAAAEAPGAGNGNSVTILVMGSDSRGATMEEALSGANSNQRADTLMLVHIPADRSRIFSVSLMRDLWVGIPGHREAKINAALAYGGVPLMVQTVESLFNHRIDHVAMIDFEGFVGLTDALGGVEVNITKPFVSSHESYRFKQGPYLLDGEHALEFVRERYAFSDGDYQRVRNQQAFVQALFAKNLKPETLLNPVKVHNVISAIAPFISADRGLDAAALARLALELREVRSGDMKMFTLPTLGTGTSADGQSIVIPDRTAIAGISRALADDSLDTFVANKGLAGGH